MAEPGWLPGKEGKGGQQRREEERGGKERRDEERVAAVGLEWIRAAPLLPPLSLSISSVDSSRDTRLGQAPGSGESGPG